MDSETMTTVAWHFDVIVDYAILVLADNRAAPSISMRSLRANVQTI